MEKQNKMQRSLVTHSNLLSLFKSNASAYDDILLMSEPQEKGNFLKNSALAKIRERKKNQVSQPQQEEEEPKIETTTEKETEQSSEPDKSESESSAEEVAEDSPTEEVIDLQIYSKSTWKNVPWLTKDPADITDHINLQLHEEIIQFYSFIQPTELEIKHRKDFIERLTALLKRVHEPAELQIFGSYATDFVLPGSDIDFNIISPDLKEDERHEFLQHLYNVLKLDENTLKGSLEFISKTKVPIVKFTDKITGQHCDISFNSGGFDAVDTINKYSKRYPAMKYLISIVKYFMKQRGLNEVFTGGISSYSLNIMMISHLQMHTANYKKDFVPITSLATLLVDFFALYGIYYNYADVAIEITSGGMYRMKTNAEKNRDGNRMVLIDPTNKNNNVSGGTRNVDMVKQAFYSAFSLLTSDSVTSSPSILSRIITIDQTMVARRIYVYGDKEYEPPFMDSKPRKIKTPNATKKNKMPRNPVGKINHNVSRSKKPNKMKKDLQTRQRHEKKK